MLSKQKGFTLIELLVVIAIISLLATLAVTSLSNTRIKARDTSRVVDIKEIVKALELYYSDNNSYPSSLAGDGSWDGIYTCWGDSSTNWIIGLAPTYMAELPRDPRNHTTCGEQYIYRSDGINYKLLSHNPEDCARIVSAYPVLFDPVRDCWAVGYWTPGAKNW